MNTELALACAFWIGAAISLIGGMVAISQGYGWDSHWRPIGIFLVVLTVPLVYFAVLFSSAA